MMKVVTFGDIMLRLSPKRYNRIVLADSFDAVYGGAEANVAVSLATLGLVSEFVTKIPDNFLGKAVLNALSRFNVKTEHIKEGGERLGVYYYEKGIGLRSSNVIYDRKYSSFSTAAETDFDWDSILEGACLFHVTGITPALSPNLLAACETGLKRAQEKGITVSLDTNYRSKLWDVAAASKALKKLVGYADILFATPWDAENIYNVNFSDLAAMHKIKYLAHTVRNEGYGGVLYCEGEKYCSDMYTITAVDRVGAGDAFSAGLIYSFLKGYSPQDAVEFAAASGYIKHTIEGDFNIVSASEIKGIIANKGLNAISR